MMNAATTTAGTSIIDRTTAAGTAAGRIALVRATAARAALVVSSATGLGYSSFRDFAVSPIHLKVDLGPERFVRVDSHRSEVLDHLYVPAVLLHYLHRQRHGLGARRELGHVHPAGVEAVAVRIR